MPGEIEELTAFLNRCAAYNRIWINTGCRIKNPDARYKCSVDSGGGDEKYLADRYLPFEITDSNEADACDRRLGGIWYSDNGARIAAPGGSGLPDIENFLVRIMDNELIRCVQIAFDPAHGYVPSEYPHFEITANEVCKTLMSVPCHSAVPDGELNIRKTGGKIHVALMDICIITNRSQHMIWEKQ